MTATATDQIIDSYVASFQTLDQRSAGKVPAWLEAIREEGMNRFVERGFPTTRDEEWRHTNVAPIAKRQFSLASAEAPAISADSLAPLRTPGLTGCSLVFVDGWFARELSRVDNLPKGLTVLSLAEAIRTRPEAVRTHLAQHALPDHDPFTALNTAFVEDGAYVHVARGTVVEQPIELLYVSTGREESMTHPRNLIVAEANSQASVIEHYVSLSDGVYFANGVTEAVLGENAQLGHYWIEEESPEAFSIATLRAGMARDAQLESHTVLFGGALVRNNVEPVLNGEGCHCLINGLYVGRGRQHLDNHMLVDHAKPHGASRQFYKGILDDRARAVFAGRIIVRPDAQKTDAKQSNMNLLLSEDAAADSKPQLEIYADDVKCTHGATIGQINQDAVFYLRSRGIDEASARAMLVHAFAAESLERFKIEPLRQHLESLLARRLQRGE